MKKPIEKPTDKKLLKRLSTKGRQQFEESEWNTSKYKKNTNSHTPVGKSIRVTKKPSRTLADLLKVRRR